MLTSKHAADFLGISQTRATQLSIPCQKVPSATGGLYRKLYHLEDLQAYKDRVEAQRLKKVAAQIKKDWDIDPAKRPDREVYWSSTEAKEESGHSKDVLLANLKFHRVYVESKPFIFYKKSEVLALPKDATSPTRWRGSSRRKPTEADDPCGCIVKPRMGTRLCPGGCQTRMDIGQYCCNRPECLAKLREVPMSEFINAELAYGGMA